MRDNVYSDFFFGRLATSEAERLRALLENPEVAKDYAYHRSLIIKDFLEEKLSEKEWHFIRQKMAAEPDFAEEVKDLERYINLQKKYLASRQVPPYGIVRSLITRRIAVAVAAAVLLALATAAMILYVLPQGEASSAIAAEDDPFSPDFKIGILDPLPCNIQALQEAIERQEYEQGVSLIEICCSPAEERTNLCRKLLWVKAAWLQSLGRLDESLATFELFFEKYAASGAEVNDQVRYYYIQALLAKGKRAEAEEVIEQTENKENLYYRLGREELNNVIREN